MGRFGRLLFIMVCAVLGAVFAIPSSPARADLPKALWLPGNVAAEDEPALREALATELEVELLPAATAQGQLERMAAELEEDTSAARRERAQREAVDHYVHLRFAQAQEAWDHALEATLASQRGAAEALAVSELIFGRAIAHLAAQRTPEAERDLSLVLALNSEFHPDTAEYGPPILRAIDRARRGMRRGRRVPLRIDRAPADARVRVDGREVTGSGPVRLRAGLHLVTVARLGYVPQSKWVDVPRRGQADVAFVLAAAEGPLLASQAMHAWPIDADGERTLAGLTPELRPIVARVLGAHHVIEATRDEGGQLSLALLDAGTGGLVRQARGQRVEWEPAPYQVLAAALDGRLISPPPASEVTLAVSAPSTVSPEAVFPIRVAVRDTNHHARRVAVRCGQQQSAASLSAEGQSAVTLNLTAPTDEQVLICNVYATDEEGRVIARAPDRIRIGVEAREAGAAWYERWYVWGAIGAGLAAGITAGVLATRGGDDPLQVLVIDGPQ